MERFLLILGAIFVAAMLGYAILLAPPANDLTMDKELLSELAKDVPDDEWFQKEVLDSEIPVLVDFQAVWCGPCKIMKKSIDVVSDRHTGAFKVVELDTDERPELAKTYRADAIPMILWFENGKPIDGFVGAASAADLEKFVSRHL